MKHNHLQLDLFTGTCAHTCAHTYAPTIIDQTTRKIDQSIRMIRTYNRWKHLTLAYSGGKDSDCVLHLCKLANVPIIIVHNSTTIDPPGTIAHCLKQGAIIQRPKLTFFQLVAKKGLPSMYRRFCCSYLKEKYIASPLLLGVRANESAKRAARYTEPTACRIYSKKVSAELVLPIVHWDNQDIIKFATQEYLQFHPHYYNNGKFDVTRRVGCIGCPLQGDRGVSDYLQHPKFLRLLIKSYNLYVTNHKCIHGVYEDVLWQLFYSNHGNTRYQQTYHGLFDAPDAKQFLEQYFNIDL